MIRKATAEDAPQIFALVAETIDACYPGHYSGNIVQTFHKFHSLDSIMSDIKSEKCYLAEEGPLLLGTVPADGVHVRRLFVAPFAQGQGVGSALLREAERAIFSSHRCVTVDASLPAETFYEKMGYAVVRECSEEVCGERIAWKVYQKSAGERCGL